MVTLSRIYTKTGDKGETSLGDGTRVPKHAPRIALMGALDEANAAIGIARLHTDGEIDAMLARIQNDLFDLGADICVPATGPRSEGALRVAAAQTKRLEEEIDSMNAALQPLQSFVLPGGETAAAYLHLARTLVRRAETSLAALSTTEDVGEEAKCYVNRLSDHLFVVARRINAEGSGDILWVPGQHR
ncbi:MAG: cob(I)yrinic acid a,c-diamide adenosyltransferase [Micropepsaceae bacterium]